MRHLIGYIRIPEVADTELLRQQEKQLTLWCKQKGDKLESIFEEIGDPGNELGMALAQVLNDPLNDGLIITRLATAFSSHEQARSWITQLEGEKKLLVVTNVDLVLYQTPHRTMGRVADAFADLYNDNLAERLAIGREKREVRAGGRPKTPIDIEVVKELLGKMPMYSIANTVGVSIRTLERRMNKWREEGLL
jgi:hypothetical protein